MIAKLCVYTKNIEQYNLHVWIMWYVAVIVQWLLLCIVNYVVCELYFSKAGTSQKVSFFDSTYELDYASIYSEEYSG